MARNGEKNWQKTMFVFLASMEDNLNERRPEWKTNSMEDGLNGRQP